MKMTKIIGNVIAYILIIGICAILAGLVCVGIKVVWGAVLGL